MAFAYRGRRVAKDNIAAGSITGMERVIGGSTSDLAAVSDPSLWSTDAVSPYGCILETGGISNISSANLPGIENTVMAGGKITSDGEPL